MWSVPCVETDVPVMQERFRVINIAKNDTGISLRILSDTKPDDNVVNVSPSLEDYYLTVFSDAQNVIIKKEGVSLNEKN